MSLLSNLLVQSDTIGGSLDPIGRFFDPDTATSRSDGIESAITGFDIFATTLFGFLTTLAGLMFVLWFLLGGLNWIIAGGDSGKIDRAKSQMTNAAIGLIIVVATYSIALIVGAVLGINILDPGSTIRCLGATAGCTPGSI